MERWAGKVAVITGASAGIGAAIAKTLVQNGLKVVGIARRTDKIEELAANLTDATGQLYGLKCDITSEESILKCFKWISDNFGELHVLINNAGVVKSSSLTDGSTDDWKRVFDINVMALCICTREAVKIMKCRNISGHIINMNSTSGHLVPNLKGKSSFNVYPASKFAVRAITESLRLEFRADKLPIRVTSISPGLVKYDSVSQDAENGRPESSNNSAIVSSSQLGLRPEDVAEAVVYVLSTAPHVQVQDVILKALGDHQ